MTHCSTRSPLRFSIFAALLLGACGTSVEPTDDGGPADAAADAAVPISAPVVVRTSPAHGAREVARETSFAVTFDRPMRAEVGEVTARVGESTVALGTPSWDSEGRTVTVQPTAALPPQATVAVTVSAGFTSADGVPLTAAHTFDFETRDDVAPRVTEATPAEGASAVDPDLSELVLTFSEPMRRDGVARLEGGRGELGIGSWIDGALHLPVSGLAPNTAYRVELEAFRDRAGNPLDGSHYLGDGALDFTTGDDVSPPVVVGSNPSEGQLDVRVGLVTRVAFDFSEPMRTSAGSAALEAGGESWPLTGEWSRGDTRVSFDVAGLLRIEQAHRVVVEGFEDTAGNALDGAAYLGDGALDFTTGVGALSPFVAHTEPVNGATVTAGEWTAVRVVFSEAMDTARTEVVLESGPLRRTLSGTWNEAGTALTLDARGLVHAGTSYRIDLAGFVDATGSPLDLGHPYLGDGVFEFSTALGTGERCGDALSMAQSTPIAGGVEWVIPAGAVSFNDGSASCAPSSGTADVVVHYRKTTPAARDGGTVLHVTAINPATGTNPINVAIYADRCDLADPGTLRRCVHGRNPWQAHVDGGPGDYFIWVGRSNTLTFAGATIRVEERALPAEGESCQAPWSTSTASPVYTAPASAGAPHVWEIPALSAHAYDIGVSMGGEGAISCAPNGRHGPDAVLRFDKSTDTSLVHVTMTASGVPPTTSVAPSFRAAIEVLDRCDPSDPASRSFACHADLLLASGSREVTLSGPAGPRFVWMAAQAITGDFQGATVAVSEYEPAPGESCATAIPITPGTGNDVAATSTRRAYAPSCLSGGGVTWYRYTTTQGLGIVRTNGATIGGVVDAATGREHRCGDDALSEGIPVFSRPGDEVCVAVASSPTITRITIEEIPYSGVRGIETVVPIERPAGAPITPSLGTSGWMAPFQGRIWSGRFQHLFHAPLTGGDYTWDSVSPSCRYAGIARPEGLYCLSETNGTGTPRLMRVVDATGDVLATPELVDVLPDGFQYPNQRFDGLAWDGTQFIVASTNGNTTGTNPTWFFSIPAGGGAPVLLGSNDSMHNIGALAVDADYLYLYGRAGTDVGIYRLSRARLDDPSQPPALLTGAYSLVTSGGSIAVDDSTEARVVYFRPIGNASSRADIVAIVEPRDDTPRWVGPLWRAPGNRQDNGFGLDPSGPSMWLIHTNGDTSGVWVRLD